MAVELFQQPQAPAPPQPQGREQRRDQLVKGRKKAAVLLVALGPERASEVFKHLHFDEIESLSLEMAKLQHIDPSVTVKVLEELAATVAAYE
jgi:flagellar motor switch protein FliG